MPVQHRLLIRPQSANGRLSGQTPKHARQLFMNKLIRNSLATMPGLRTDPIGIDNGIISLRHSVLLIITH